MSAWGREDNIIMTANVMFVAGTTRVTNSHGNVGVAGTFDFASNAYGNITRSPTGGIVPGDYIVLHPNQAVDGGQIGDSGKYQVANVGIEAANVIHVTMPVSFTANVVHPSVQQGPKYIANIASGSVFVNRGNIGADPGTRNLYSIQRVYGIDKDQANNIHNAHERNIKTPGWYSFFSYIDANGQTRHKAESLVAMSKHGIDHLFDYPSEIPVFNLHFSQQPNDPPSVTSNVADANVHLFANAFSSPEGAIISYKWLVQNTDISTAFIDVGAGAHGAAGISGQTTNVLFVANVSRVSGQTFICHAFTENEFGKTSCANSNATTVEVSS